MIISMFPAGGSGSGSGGEIIDGYNYTGEAEYIDDGEGNWRIKFLSSGILSLAQDVNVDIFAVGGGSGGFTGFTGSVRLINQKAGYDVTKTYYECGGGGSGGSVAMLEGRTLQSKYSYEIVIGEGGAQNSPGGETKINGVISAAGGTVTHYNDSKSGTVEGGESFTGAWGGTGGGAGSKNTWEPSSPEPTQLSRIGGSGGTDGGNGSGWGLGMGQGDSTREFGEVGGTLYAGGGAGGSLSSTVYQGGAGGGGNGASTSQAATNGAPNTGSGGGGGCYSVNGGAAGSGGSGILIIRNARG